jgi:hypothetical protein
MATDVTVQMPLLDGGAEPILAWRISTGAYRRSSAIDADALNWKFKGDFLCEQRIVDGVEQLTAVADA